MTLRVGLIGCGTAGRAHAEAYRQIEGVSLTAVADLDQAAAARLAAIFGGEPMSPEELLATRVDIIDIATPTPTHAPLIEAAARQGRHVICETPLARTLDQARAAIASCREAGVSLVPLHLNSYLPPLRKAVEILAGEDSGKAGIVRITRRRPGVPASYDDWRRSLKASGGVILDLLSQDIAFLLGCFGPVQRVYAASTAYREIMTGEYALVSLRFKNGVIAHLDGNWLPEGLGGDEFEVATGKGLITFAAERGTALKITTSQDPGRPHCESPVDEGMYELGLAAVLQALEEGSDPPVGPELALATLEVALAALESAATGRVFTLE